MGRRSKIIIGCFILVILGILIAEIVRPRPIDWRPSYTRTDTIPFGCLVLFNELAALFDEGAVETVDDVPFEFLQQITEAENQNYIFINNQIIFDEKTAEELLQFVAQGNTVFLASAGMDQTLRDTLNIGLDYFYSLDSDTLNMKFVNPKLVDNSYVFDRYSSNTYFTKIDTANTVVLGTVSFSADNLLEGDVYRQRNEVNFIQAPFGDGSFLIHTNPEVFTNYHLLKNDQYARTALSYLKPQKTFWDTYFKSGKVVINSPMRYVLNQRALKWAYYLGVTALLLFAIFRAKREQRIIPVIPPVENSSVTFAQTVGSLYYQHGDLADLARKKISYFFAYSRSHYYLDLKPLNEEVVHKLAQKTGKPVESTQKFIAYLKQMQSVSQPTEKQLQELHQKIEDFKN